jgi:hypothetical protein
MKRLIPAAFLLTLMACGSSAPPTQPTPPAARAAVTIVGFSVTGVLAGTQYRYSIPFSLQNTGSAAATIVSVEFRVTVPGAAVGTATLTGTELFGSTSLAPGASTPRPTVNLTDTTDRPFATSITAVVTFTDAVGTNTATASADVPALPAPPPTITFALSGTIVEGSAGVSGARVEVTTGPDAGAAVLTDGSGSFVFAALQAGAFTLLVSKSGYGNLQQNVTLSGNTSGLRLNLAKSASPPPPPSGLCAPATGSCGTATARCNDGTLSCSQNRSGTCSSHQGVSCFICPGLLCNGIAGADGVSWTPVPLAFTPMTQSVKRE